MFFSFVYLAVRAQLGALVRSCGALRRGYVRADDPCLGASTEHEARGRTRACSAGAGYLGDRWRPKDEPAPAGES
jgi:hypothetical protein